MKESFKIRRYINSEIKVGDNVKIIDGSGLTPKKGYREEVFIVLAYPKLTGSSTILKEITGIVIESGVKDFVSTNDSGSAYLQDVVVKIGDAEFRTCSQFLRKEQYDYFETIKE